MTNELKDLLASLPDEMRQEVLSRIKTTRIIELEKKLQPRQKMFAQEFLVDLNRTQAYIRAGYSETGAKVGAHGLYHKPGMNEYIQWLFKQREAAVNVSATKVVRELCKIAFGNITDVLEEDEDGNISIKHLKNIKVPEIVREMELSSGKPTRIKLNDKIKALELLGKHTRAFTDTIDITTNGKEVGHTIVNNIKIAPRADKVRVKNNESKK